MSTTTNDQRSADGTEKQDRHFVVGTCGHIDHGKTSLVQALTGTDPDRLPEEKRRGITIELGFALWDLGQCVTASVVDVPGHEKFVRTMAAGAGGLDAVICVVAADDGVMPQTEEHLAICRLLGVKRGVIALTKADLVEDDLLELVAEDVRDACRGSFLEGAELIITSSTTRRGLDALTTAVRRLAEDLDGARPSGPGLLPVDRVFTRPGFGTIVTGTQLLGEFEVGAEVEIIPGARGTTPKATVRGLQVHGARVESSGPSSRVAMNLRGLETTEIARGDVVTAARSRLPAPVLHGTLEVLESASSVNENDELTLHIGTADRLARVVPLAREPILPGHKAWVRLVLSEPVGAYVGQRFILRKAGLHGQGTVGGGEVLDLEPSAGRRSFARWREVAEALSEAGDDLSARIQALLKDARADGLAKEELVRRCPPASAAIATAEKMAAEGVILAHGKRFLDLSVAEEAMEAMRASADALHDQRPFLLGISGSELTGGLPRARQKIAEAALALLVSRGDMVRAGAGYRLASRPVSDQVTQGLKAVLQALQAGAAAPPAVPELAALASLDAAATRDVLDELKRRGEVEPLKEGLHFATSTLRDLETKVRSYFAADHQELTTADFKTLSGGASRKYAIPLLEYLDRQGLTRRAGEGRVAGSKLV